MQFQFHALDWKSKEIVNLVNIEGWEPCINEIACK